MTSVTTGNEVQKAIISYTKAKSAVLSLLPTGTVEVRELEWQGTEFQYPNIRVSVDFYPSINGCQPSADVFFDIFSEKKSSNEASTIAGVIQNVFHKIPFSSQGIQFFSSVVKSVPRPERDMYGWHSRVEVRMILT